MSASEKTRDALVPAAALFLGLASGSFIRPSTPPVPTKPASQSSPIARGNAASTSSGPLAEVRPVLQLMAEALGVDDEDDPALRAARVLSQALDASPDSQGISPRGAADTLFQELQRRRPAAPQQQESPSLKSARRLDELLLSQTSPEARVHKLRDRLTNEFLQEESDNDLFTRLIEQAKTRDADVQFLIATIPDYVDSNSGWNADPAIGAIQAAMGRSDYLLDRFRLIDWTRNDPRSETPVLTDSRLHEKQPGALIFRCVDTDSSLDANWKCGRKNSNLEHSSQKSSGDNNRDERWKLSYRIVLLVLETPTSGIHSVALRNAADLVLRWHRERHDRDHDPELKIIGPYFSGSVLPLALALHDIVEDEAGKSLPTSQRTLKPESIHVISGSANATDNDTTMQQFAAHVDYHSTLRTTDDVNTTMAAALARLNNRWANGDGIALLVESNTAYGTSIVTDGSRTHSSQQSDPFPRAFVFRFPLHIAQLRSDAPVATAPVSLLPSTLIPLNLRETTPPADQLPPLRPQTISALVETHIHTILDNLRHERVSAVGIVATDDRDVLFLAREVKRELPDAQLFFLGTHLLYLHPEYVPYMRGALVASPYALTPRDQRVLVEAPGATEPTRSLRNRQTFSSMAAQGIYNATMRQLGAPVPPQLDACDPEGVVPSTEPCLPPVWIAVIGDDGYWPLGYSMPTPKNETGSTASPHAQPQAQADRPFVNSPRHIAPIPAPARLVAIVLLVMLAVHLFAAVYIRSGLSGTPEDRKRHMRLPIIRMLTPPPATEQTVRSHAKAVNICLAVVVFVCVWAASVFVLHFAWQAGPDAAGLATMLLVHAVPVIFVLPLALYWRQTRRAQLFADKDAPPQPQSKPPLVGLVMMWVTLAMMLASLGTFVAFVMLMLLGGSTVQPFAVERMIAGGVVSPSFAILLLFGAFYVAAVSGVRRLSYLGYGYAVLGEQSAAFRLFAGAAHECPGSSFSMTLLPEQAIDKDTREQNQRHNDQSRDLRYFAGFLDMPLLYLHWSWGAAIFGLIAVGAWNAGRITTVDGAIFSTFLMIASYSSLIFSLLMIVQAAQTWRILSPKLNRLAHSPLDGVFRDVGKMVDWNLTLVPPRSSELQPLVHLVDLLRRRLMELVQREHTRKRELQGNRRKSCDVQVMRTWGESTLAVRGQDLRAVARAMPNIEELEKTLTAEIATEKFVPLLRSAVWRHTWSLSNAMVGLLERSYWRRLRNHSAAAGWFKTGEQLIALQFAFLIRDIVARIMAALFTAVLCLTLVACAHLFYIFQGRSSMLTIDVIAIAIASLVSIQVLVAIERDRIIGSLRQSKPGRVNFSWDFARRLAIYGALPLLAVVGALFPEIGDSLFGWLAPLRNLTTY